MTKKSRKSNSKKAMKRRGVPKSVAEKISKSRSRTTRRSRKRRKG